LINFLGSIHRIADDGGASAMGNRFTQLFAQDKRFPLRFRQPAV
jgi:hypothetical protein